MKPGGSFIFHLLCLLSFSELGFAQLENMTAQGLLEASICTVDEDCFKDGNLCHIIEETLLSQNLSCTCLKNGTCKPNYGCGRVNEEPFRECDICDEEFCEDEGLCKWLNETLQCTSIKHQEIKDSAISDDYAGDDTSTGTILTPTFFLAIILIVQ